VKPSRTVAAASVATVALTVLPASTASASILCDYWPTACGADPDLYVKISHNQAAKRAAEPSAWDRLIRNMTEPNPNFWYRQEQTPTEGHRVPRFGGGSSGGGGGPFGLCPEWRTQPC